MSVTSEETDYPASNLLTPKKGNKGWQCKRFGVFPQEVILGFPQMSHISSMQLLSHQSKISTKVDILVAKGPSSTWGGDVGSLVFKKIGYFMLSNNESSNFQSRELKTVYIDSNAAFLKLVLHKPHMNAVNLFNQVGIIAVIFFGEARGGPIRTGGGMGGFNVNTGMQAMSRQQSKGFFLLMGLCMCVYVFVCVFFLGFGMLMVCYGCYGYYGYVM
jgi:centrosomal protein CEP104